MNTLILIDGQSCTGKSTIGKKLAKKLNLPYFSTGNIFRAFAYALKYIDINDHKLVEENLKNIHFQVLKNRLWFGGEDWTDKIMDDSLSMSASTLSALPFVRKKYEQILKQIVKDNPKGIILDGRDLGTKIFPKCPCKFYFISSPENKAKFRAKDLHIKKNSPEYQKLLQELIQRDKQDQERTCSPLKPAKDAIIIDSAQYSLKQLLKVLLDKINQIYL